MADSPDTRSAKLIRQEGRLLLCAVQFLTRIPTPELRGFRSEWIQQSARYYSLVGQIVGSIAALTLLAAAHIWGAPIGALLAVGAGIALTGGFHEDGLQSGLAVAEQLGGVDRVSIQMTNPRMAHADLLRGIELLGTEVAPRVRDEVARRAEAGERAA